MFFRIFDIIKINTGYAIPINNSKTFQGITFGVEIRIGITKATEYYDHTSIKLF